MNHKPLKRASQIEESDFLRACSSLLTNSLEAIEKIFSGKAGGKILISLKEKGGNVVITVLDNGVGIPKEYIDRVQKEGFTYGKKKGTGLGLYYVLQKIQEWRGELDIDSEQGKWTRVEIAIPFDANIKSFESSLKLSQFEEILIIDDDQSIFDRWARKLRFFSGNLEYLSQPNISKSKMDKIQAGKCLPLVDQEFRGNLKTGLSFIMNQKLSKKSFLVTNSYHKPELLEEANKIGLRVIPKPIIEDLIIS